ncbi:hypothetical protein [Yersinia aldovae]|nr:hypothetical protein [Yersinia aldovae]
MSENLQGWQRKKCPHFTGMTRLFHLYRARLGRKPNNVLSSIAAVRVY